MFCLVIYEYEPPDRPDEGDAIIASADPAIIGACADAFVKKLGGRTPGVVRRLGTRRPARMPPGPYAPEPTPEASLAPEEPPVAS
jgi:hypothetical protein